MTRERDRIQENANKYIIKNCPTLMGNRLCFGRYTRQCADCTDCVIKQVIEKCTNSINTTFSNECFELAKEVTNLFDIEEINK